MALVVAVLIGLLILLLVALDSIRLGITPNPSSKKVFKELETLLPKTVEGPIYELGAGFGGVALYLANKYSQNPVVAFEGALIPYLIFRLRLLINGTPKNLRLHYGNYLKKDLKRPGLIYTYLYPAGMDKVKKWIQEKGYENFYLVSFTFALPGAAPKEKVMCQDLYRSNLYLYKLN